MLPHAQKIQMQLANRIGVAFMEKFGSQPPASCCMQIQREWNSMLRSHQYAELWMLSELAEKLKRQGCPVYRTSGESLLLDLIGLPVKDKSQSAEQFVTASLRWPGEGNPAKFQIFLPSRFYRQFRDALTDHWCQELHQPAILMLSGEKRTVYEREMHISFGNLKFYFHMPQEYPVSFLNTSAAEK